MSFLPSSRLASGSVNLLSTSNELSTIADDILSPPCCVYLYTRPVLGTEGKGIMGASHWVLYFDWGYYSHTYDANEKNGILAPSDHEGAPKAPGKLTYSVKKIKSNLRVTPHVVDAKAKANKYSYMVYSLINANCQTWAKELARLLGFSLPPGQVVEFTDLAVTGGAAVALASVAVAKAMSN